MGHAWDWAGLVGRGEAEFATEFGAATSRRHIGDDVWLVFETKAGPLRVRCEGGGAFALRAASWTLTLTEAAVSLREATEPLGLWPEAGPDVDADAVAAPLVRRALPGADGSDAARSFTATVRGGRFTTIAVFDEPPDWL